MRRVIPGVLCLPLSACVSMQTATYSNFADNTVALRMYSTVKVSIASMEDQSGFDPDCRLVGRIEGSGGRAVPEFIRDSFNDELKFAGIYSDGAMAVRLQATLVAARFSSLMGVTQGSWDFTLRLTNPANMRGMTVSYSYPFGSGFSGDVACANVSLALTPAVQRLISAAIAAPAFPTLIVP